MCHVCLVCLVCFHKGKSLLLSPSVYFLTCLSNPTDAAKTCEHRNSSGNCTTSGHSEPADPTAHSEHAKQQQQHQRATSAPATSPTTSTGSLDSVFEVEPTYLH